MATSSETLHIVLLGWLVVLSPCVFGADCNGNGVEDLGEVSAGTSEDCNGSGLPDECEQAVLRLGRNGVFTDVGTVSLFDGSDVDGDGDLDVVTGWSGVGGSRVVVRLNRLGEQDTRVGDLSEPFVYSVGSGLTAMEPDDVDGDGDIDVALVTRSGAEILWNDGTGALSDSETLPLAARGIDLSLADVSGDGRLDLVVLHRQEEGAPQVSVFISEGGGSFQPPHFLSGDGRTVALATADVDGDGDVDIATAKTLPAGVSILLNDGCADSCSFSELIHIPTDQLPHAVRGLSSPASSAAALVVAAAETAYVIRHTGDGTFETADFAVFSGDLDVGDLDSDGDLDIVSGARGSATLMVLVNAGNDSFESTIGVEVGSQVRAFGTGDFDGDNRLDVAVVSARGELEIFLNGLEESNVFEKRTVTLGAPPHTVALADFDGDADLDLVTGNGSHRSLSIFLNDPPGFLSVKTNMSIGTGVGSIGHGDFDKDGDVDLILSGLRLYENRGNAVFSPKGILGSVGGSFPVAADLNGDEWLDLISTGNGRYLSILLNDGAGTLGREVRLTTGAGTRNAAPGDFDGDGDLDIVVSNSISTKVSVLMNRGNGEFDDAQRIDAAGSPFFVVAGDFNRDGSTDVATAIANDASVGILLSRADGSVGSGLFESARRIRIGVTPQSMATGDIDGDGFLDIVTSNAASDNITTLLNDAGRDFFVLGHFKVGDEPRFARVGDVDGDGAPDVVAVNRTSKDVTLLLNRLNAEAPGFSEHICTLKDFEALAASGHDRLSVKYTLPARDAPSLLPVVFQNTKVHPLHQDFLGVVFPERFPALTAQGLIGLTQMRASRQYYIGVVERVRTDGGLLFIYSIVAGAGREEVLTVEEVRGVHERMSEALTLRPLAYAPDPVGENPLAREAAASWIEGNNDPGFPIFRDTVTIDVEFVPYTKGVGYGRVRLFQGDAFDEANDSGRLTFQDIAVIDHAPRDIEGVVGGVITAAPQGALSHISVRTARRETPNAFVDKAMVLFGRFEGKLVRLEVTESGYHVEEATENEAEKFWAERPSLPAPIFDAEYRGLDRFEEMDFSGGGDDLVARFGGKAVGLARLQIILDGRYEQYRESGFAIPMAYYLDFMRENTIASKLDGREITYQKYLEELFEMARFKTDSEFRFEALDAFRDLARNTGAIPEGLVAAIAERVEEVFGSRDVMVRHRSSSNIEDLLEFNGAGLYESTSACVADSFDEDDVGPSRCDQERDVERTIERALKKIWTSLWTFRAHEERSYYQIPQTSATMGILVNRAFLDESANGVAFTGDPVAPRSGCSIITVQVGEESVVSPEPGILPEVDILEVTDGEVVNIVRSQSSTLVNVGAVVLPDEKLRELGTLMHHIDESYPVDTEGRPPEEILLDVEFKLERDDSLAVKQIRPFLIPGGRPEQPTFELVIPPGASACGALNLAAPSGNPKIEYESKSVVRFRAGVVELPSSHCVFSRELFDEVIVGPAQEVATPEGPGIFRVSERPGPPRGAGRLYTFNYRQSFSLSGGRAFEVELFNLEFAVRGGTPIQQTVVLDDAFITFDLTMHGAAEDPPLFMTYASCGSAALPAWHVAFDLEDGAVRLQERFLRPEDLTTTGPAALESAEVNIGDERRRVTSYWNLVYSSGRHNIGVTYWVFLVPPMSIPGIDGDVHVVELAGADRPEVFDLVDVPQEAAAAYLDENFEVIGRPAVLSFAREETSFLRGDSNGDNSVDLADALRTLGALFFDGPPLACAKSADANDDGNLSTTDVLWTLRHLFRGEAVPDPAGGCGADPTPDALPCDTTVGCL